MGNSPSPHTGLAAHAGRAIARLLEAMVAAGVSALVGVTLVDVVGRYFLNAPLSGAIEVMQLSLAMSIFAALPLVTARREHVAMSVVASVAGARLRTALDLATGVAGLLVSGYIALQIWRRGEYLADTGEHTQVLAIPLAPIAFVVALLWAVGTLAWLWTVLAAARRRDDGRSP